MTTQTPSLWDFSLKLYQQPHIEALCLMLQDQWQANVNIILWLQWLESQNIFLNDAHLVSAQQKLELWHKDVVTPLRNLRRQMKTLKIADDIERLRQTVKHTELMAEKVELDWLGEMSQPWCATRSNTSPNRNSPSSPRANTGINLTLYLNLLQSPERVIEQAVNTFSTITH